MPDKIAETANDWALYSGHREHFTQAVLSAAKTGHDRLCVLGAGKSNDLDLQQLARSFSEVHLVDLEPSSVAQAISRQDPVTRRKLAAHTPVDLSLLTAKRASKWQRKPPSAAELEQLSQAALQQISNRLPGPFDVVVSACVLTQLGFALTRAFPEPHAALGLLRLSVLELHLRTLLALTGERGTALFVSDLASSSHYGLDQLPADADLAAVMRDVVAQRAFYHLARPDLIRDLLAELEPKHEPTPLAPWLWTGPQSRTYLVYGFSVSRA
jgi:hypothetical protein